jgi:hypothetical protein
MPQRRRRGSGWKPKPSPWRLKSTVPNKELISVPIVTVPISVGDAWTATPQVYTLTALLGDFKSHVEKWKRATLHTSSLTKMIAHPSYLRIIGMGPVILPFLFKELKERPDHWLVALNSITGEDPAPIGSTFDIAVEAWLRWGREHGYL